MEKQLPIYRLDIVEDEESNVEVDFVALVDRPAIERSFLAFADSYSDYPDAVKNNAKAALKWAEENGWGSCGTEVGKIRANQLANGEPISLETIKRMYSFLSRHEENANKSKGYGDGCGQLMYDAWGGKSALTWAESKIRQVEKMSFAIQDEEERIISGPLMLADTPIYRYDANGEYYVVFTKDTIKKIAQKYFKKGYQSNVNLMHDNGQVVEGVTMFESWIVDEKRGIKPMNGYEDVKDGSWFGSFKVENDDVWNMVKDGKVKGFSVEGVFNYRTQTKEEKMMKDIIDILKRVDEYWDEEEVNRDNDGRFAPKNGGGSSSGGSKKETKDKVKTEPKAKEKENKPESVRVVKSGDKDLIDLMKKAKEAAPEIDKLGKDLAKKYGGSVTPINIKSENSILRKVNTEEKGDIKQIKDSVRNTIVHEKSSTIESIITDLSKQKGFIRVKKQDHSSNPLGYSGNIVNIRGKNGIIAEIQINTPKMIYAKEKPENAIKVIGKAKYDQIAKSTGIKGGQGHAFYEQYRVLDPYKDAKKRKAIERASKKYYSNFIN